MNQRKKDKDTKEKKIRKLLLINADNEMQKTIKTKNRVLINSMTPIQLESLYKLDNEPIKILISTYTNVIEKHIVEQIVDVPNNINYFQSDFKDNRKEKKENKLLRKYKHLYSAKNFYVNYENLINKEREEKMRKFDIEYDNTNEEGIIDHIIPFISKKKSVGEEKIKFITDNIGKDGSIFQRIKKNVIKMKSDMNNNNHNLNIEHFNNNKESKDNNILFISSSEYNSGNEESVVKHHKKKKKKILDINYKLIYYCYTNLKRKRPLMFKKSNTSTIYGLQIEEEFFKRNSNALIKKTESIKKQFEPIRRSKTIKEVKSGSSKKRRSSRQKRKDTNSKDIFKKRRIKTVAYHNPENNDYPHFHCCQNGPNQNVNIHTIDVEHKHLKKKLIPLTEKIKKSTNSISKHGKLNSKYIIYKDNVFIEKAKIQNIMSKAETKTSSLDNSTYFLSLDKKSKYNNYLLQKKKKESKNNVNLRRNKYRKTEKKSKNSKRGDSMSKKIKYMNKFKHENPEETKNKNSSITKKHKNSLNEPIKVINSLKRAVGLDNDEIYIKEKSKIINKNRLKFAMVDKMKSLKFKSRKNCLNYEDNYNDEDLYYFNSRIYSNVSKRNRGESVHLKKSNILNKK